MPLQNLEDAARMLECGVGRVLMRVTCFAAPVLAMTAIGGVMPGCGLGRMTFLLGTLVQPGLRTVLFLLRIPAREQPIQIFSVAIVFAQNRRRIGIGKDVVLEPLVVLDHVVDQAPEKEDVRARAQRCPDIRTRRGARKARVDMDHFPAPLTRLHHPLKPDRMLLRHRRTHDHDCVGICQRGECRGCAAPSYRGAQTGHRGAMSNSGLVADADHA